MVGVLLLLVVLAYAGAVDDHGSEKVANFWGNQPSARHRLIEADYVLTPQKVQRFGYRFGEDDK